MKTNLISKSETNEIIELVSGQWKQKIPKVKNFKVSTIDNTAQLITGNEIIILKINDNSRLLFGSESKRICSL